VPTSTQSAGAKLYLQGVSFDPTVASPLKATVSGALEITAF